MGEFTVVDLGSQAQAVARYIAGWPRSRVLAWLSGFRNLTYEPYFSQNGFSHYSFVTPCGRGCGFWFEGATLVLQDRKGSRIHFVEVPCPDDG